MVEVAQIEIEIQENTSQTKSEDKVEEEADNGPDRLSSRSELPAIGTYFDNEVNNMILKM